MASPSFRPSERRSTGKTVFTSLFVLVLVAGLGIAGFAWWFHHAAIGALPQLDGSLKVSGLSAPVQVIRDAHGMPHISAQNLDDLFFAQGYVTAQDRLWQMDINRRYGRGELSEILGARTLKLDRLHRYLQIRESAERGIAVLPEETRHQLEQYAKGVNALIASQRSHLPIEFRVLGYEPREWTVADSLVIGLNIAESLNTQFPLEHDREALVSQLKPEEISDLYPNGSWRDRPPSALPREQQYTPVAPPAESSEEEGWLRLPLQAGRCEDCTLGSNNWVVNGAHTATGKPLLSNDMHLEHSIPNVWYETHLRSGDYNVTGVSFPGLPWIIAGHNQRVAWGYTNVGPDVQDLFIENFNGNGEYETPQGWKKPEVRHEVIRVKHGKDIEIDVQVTRHGPVVSPLFPGESRKLALQWTIYDPQTVGLGFFGIDSARNWTEFTQAISKFGGATQNVVYADVDGHIGYHAAGFVPIRATGDGLTPMPGNTDQYAWTGYIPFDQLPNVFDPASGAIGTANAKITPDGYTYLIANQWGAPYRTERIYRVIENGKDLTPADMLHLQLDTYSEFDRVMSEAMVYAIDHTPSASTRAKQAADIMREWNGRVEVDSVAPTIEARARVRLWKMILEPKLEAAYEDYHWFGSSIAMERLVRLKPKRWLPKEYANWDSLITAAVESALKDAPADLAQWKWGTQFPVNVNHPLFGGIPFLNRYSGPGRHPQSGNGSLTVKAAGMSFGASERFTVDLADLDNSTLNIVAGQSGQIFSPHYLDHWNAWYGGSTFVWPFTSQAVEKAGVHRLELHP
jgi:penicillin amidase